MTGKKLFTEHERTFARNKFVYPVVSRRSQGLSIGINLNPDKVCNFDCIYCQVDRRSDSDIPFVETDQLLTELKEMFAFAKSGEIFETEKFKTTPSHLRRINDIAFSGDGEPTTFKNFPEIIKACAELKREYQLDNVKMVLITNASVFDRLEVKRGLEILDQNEGEIWAKLDAGTQEYFKIIDRSPMKFSRLLKNITTVAQKRPIVIQSLFMNVNNEPPTQKEQEAY
ncbi:MAG: radical SAM protein, partial [Pirellulaceae bacterium]|nr:radical SAM protein [Pirellulaceae bacterium]